MGRERYFITLRTQVYSAPCPRDCSPTIPSARDRDRVRVERGVKREREEREHTKVDKPKMYMISALMDVPASKALLKT
jgi:hypothetical protein